MIEERWVGEQPDMSRPSVMLVALLTMSNDAEAERDPFVRRIKLNEMQAAIQSARSEIETLAEGLMLRGGADEEDGPSA